ncbi:MAG: prephenate dehydrogenase [bacterium]
MEKWERVSIVGMGLIGGSLALAMRGAGIAGEIVGCGRKDERLRYALDNGIADRVTKDPKEAAEGAGLVVVCTPAGLIPGMLAAIRPALGAGAVVTDAGSTKKDIVAGAEKLFGGDGPWFVGSHPMAGSEDSGVEAARADLFENALCVLTPGGGCPEDVVGRVRGVWEAAGAKVLEMGAEEHDFLVAASSHLPHLVAVTLALSLAGFSREREGVLPLLAGGFRDTTRIASGSPEVWRDICMMNREAIISMLDGFEGALRETGRVLRGGGEEEMQKLFSAAKRFRDGIPGGGRGALAGAHEVLVDAPDRPGVIAEIATALSDAGINIKNLFVQHVREMHGGTILLTLESEEDQARAAELLAAKGLRARKKS